MSDYDVPFEYLVFRLLWLFKNMHTIYDYISDLGFKDRAAARKLAGWVSKGGIPATCVGIVTNHELATKLLEVMFGRHKGLHKRVQNLLFGAIFLGYDEFRAIY